MLSHFRSGRLAVPVLAAALLVGGSAPLDLAAQDKKPETKLSADLALVPGDAAAFVHIRAADLWKSDALADLRQILSKAGPEALQVFEKRFTPPPSTIERVTVVLPTLQTLGEPFPQVDPQAMSALLIVSTAKPFDQAQLIKALATEGRQKKHKGRTYYFNEDTWSGLYLVDDRTFVTGSEDSILWLFDQPAGKAEGPLQPGVRQASGKQPLVVALNPGVFPQEAAQMIPPPLQPLLQARTATVALDLDKQWRLEARLYFAKDDQAKDGEKAARAGLEMAREALGMPIQELEKQLKAPRESPFPQPKRVLAGLPEVGESFALVLGLGFLRQLEAELKKLPVERQGAMVRLPLTVPPTSNALPAWTSMFMVAVSTMGRSANGTFQIVGQKIGGDDGDKALEDNLFKLAAAFDKYHDANGHFPPAAIFDKDGQPLLSWRVALLPYLGEEALYKQFKLDEPWDSLHNKKLIKQMPKVFQSTAPFGREQWKTTDKVFVGAGTVFDGKKGIAKKDVTDGLDRTILLVHTGDDQAVVWSKPADLPYAAGKPLPKLASPNRERFHVLLADGTVRVLKPDIAEKTLRALITRNGGEKVKVPD